MTLKARTFSAVRWTVVAAALRALLSVGQLAILARLLSPEDYGLMAIVAVVQSFAAMFSDMGFNSAYLQRRNVDLPQRSSLFWANIAISTLVMLLVMITSPLIAVFMGDERLTWLLIMSAPAFVLNALGQQIRMTAEKSLEFRPVIVAEIGAALFGFLSSVLIAYQGGGVYALVTGGLVSAGFSSIFAWLFVRRGWRPLWRFRMEDIRPYMGFGGAMVANGLVNQVNMSMDLLLGARILPASQIGLYSVPRNLMLQIQFLINPIITRVGFPLIAQIQDDIPRVRAVYLKTLNMTSATNAPLYVGIAFFAPDVVHVLLGANWTGSVDFLRILALWGYWRSTGNPVGSLLFGLGRASLALKWNVAMMAVVPLVLWVGARQGAEGLAWALLGFQLVMLIPGWYILIRPLCQAGLLEYLTMGVRPLLLSLASIAAAYGIAGGLEIPIMRLLVALLTGTPLYLLLSWWFNREWTVSMIELFGVRFGARVR